MMSAFCVTKRLDDFGKARYYLSSLRFLKYAINTVGSCGSVLKLEQKLITGFPAGTSARSERIGTAAFGILAAPNFDDIAICGTTEILQCEARLDDFDRLLARNVFGDENVHLA
jgi:hypothetical protein